jgi:DNA-binding MarR family transcriptional regulator
MTEPTKVEAARAPSMRCTCAYLRRTARRMTQAYDLALRETGLKITQYSILANVARKDGLTITDLARRIALERSTLSRNLEPLCRAGLIRITEGADRRSRAVEITRAGRARFDAAYPVWEAAERAFQSEFGAKETRTLHALLDRTIEKFRLRPTQTP